MHDKNLHLKFDGSSGKILLSEIGRPDGQSFIARPSSLLWRINLVTDDLTELNYSSSEADSADIESLPDKLVMRWQVGQLEVVVSIRMSESDSLSYWSLKATLPEGYRMQRCDFPILPTISRSQALKLAAPVCWGLEYDLTPGMRYQATYPSLTAVMQFLGFYGTGDVLYIGTHDPLANHKVYRVTADEEAVSHVCENWPALPETSGGEYLLPYEAAIGIVDGSWYEAAQLYRKWALTAPWSRAGKVSERSIPQWLKETDLWLRVEFEYEGVRDFCRQAHEYFDVPTSIHWYKWHEIPYDTLYPDYFPTRPGFAEGVRELQSLGYQVMPYINGRIVDPNSKGWNEEELSRAAARQANGEPYTEVYGSKVPLNTMCPSTTAWQEKVAYLAERLTAECGVNGVYIDQIGCAKAYLCYNREHPHPPGGGTFWVESYRHLLDKVRERLPPECMLTTEENIECFIDKFDALLVVNTPCQTTSNVIPLFPAVYSGRVITFGFQYIGNDDLLLSKPFRAKMAREFIFGAQIGWVLAGLLMNPAVEKEREFVRNLARCRGSAHKYLLGGRLLGLVEVGGDNPRVKFTAERPFLGGEYTLDLPSVFASAWEAEDGSIAVALANMSDEPRDVELQAAAMDHPRQMTIAARDAAVIEVATGSTGFRS